MKIRITIKANTVNIYNGDSYMGVDDDDTDLPAPTPDPKPGLSLRPYQEDAFDSLKRLLTNPPPSPKRMMEGATAVKAADINPFRLPASAPQRPASAPMQQVLDAALFNMLFGADAGEDCMVQVGDTLFHISGCGCSPKPPQQPMDALGRIKARFAN